MMSRRAAVFLSMLVALAGIGASWRRPAPAMARAAESAETSLAANPAPAESETGLAEVGTRNPANLRLRYLYCFPTRLRRNLQDAHPVLVIVPGLSGRVVRVDPATWGRAANGNGWIILSPHFQFDRRDWETATSYQYPQAWSGQALLDIMRDFSARSRLRLGRCFLHGVSAGAQFAVRFALWRPALCRAVAAHAGGGTITPEEHVPVRFFVSIGRDDRSRRPQFDWFVQKAAEKGISVRSRIYPGGHSLPPEQVLDAIRFFQENR